MDIKILKSQKEYNAAMKRLSKLMDITPPEGSTEEREMELLALVIEDYERKIVQPVKPDPVDAILFRMDQMGLRQKDLAPYLGSLSKVSEVLSRKRSLSLNMIRKLRDGLGIPADILIGDADGAIHKKAS